MLDDRVSLKLFDEDNYDAPTLGVQHPYVVNEYLINHGFVDITADDPATTTEDDVLYQSLFRLEEGKEYDGLRVRYWAYNSATGEEFTLEDLFIDFDNQPFIAGVHEVDYILNRGFNLPPSTDRNIISLQRSPVNDIAGFYALQLNYGYLSRWEYWVANANVDDFFFDANEPNNGDGS